MCVDYAAEAIVREPIEINFLITILSSNIYSK